MCFTYLQKKGVQKMNLVASRIAMAMESAIQQVDDVNATHFQQMTNKFSYILVKLVRKVRKKINT